MFANCQLFGLDLGFPDICKTPPALLPIPYPNMGLGSMGLPNAWNILLMAMPAHNLLTKIGITNGDNAGAGLGLLSPSVMGQTCPITCVVNVLFKCIPATRLTGVSSQNRCNTVGGRVAPSQIKVQLLGGGRGGGAGKGGRGSGPSGSGSGKGGSASASRAKAGHNAKTASVKPGQGKTAAPAKSGAANKPASSGKSPTPGKSGKPRQKSLRERYLGRTPGKNSRTGREVQARMRKKGTLRENPWTGKTEFKASNGKWYDLKHADMAHRRDAVTWWNKTGRRYGAKSPEVRKWMLNSKNYTLDHYSLNRSAGAKLGQRYKPPLK